MSESSLPLSPPRPSADVPEPAVKWSWAERLESLVTSRTMLPFWLGLILLLGAAFRFTGLDWDEGQHLHPDERFLTMVTSSLEWPQQDFLKQYFDESTSTLNPRNRGHGFWVYGDFPILFIKRISMVLDMTGYDHVYLVGRAVDGLVDLGTVLMLFLLARRLYKDDRVALLASLFFSMTALAIQQSHFFVVDTFTAFFVTVALYFMARVFDHGRMADYALAGAFVGLALASKLSIFTLALVVAIVGAYRFYTMYTSGETTFETALERVAVRLAVAGFMAILCFRIFQPYAFQGPSFFDIRISERWWQNAQEARSWVSGERDAPFGHQWTSRTAILFPLQNMILWGMGVPLGLTAWVGWAVAAWQLVRRQRWVHLIPVVWIGLLFLHQGTQWVKSLRYFLPIYPALVMMAAWLLVWLWDEAKKREPAEYVASFHGVLAWTPRKAGVLMGAVVLGTLLYAIAFTSIYTRPHTRVAASRWIYATIPPGTIVANETTWDDALPLRVDGKDGYGAGMYTGVNLQITDEEAGTYGEQKLQNLLNGLDQAEYIFISSNRQYDSLVRLPMRFPMAVKYYDALFSGALGWERVQEFTSYPQLFGLELPDQGAEEAWSVYDHPRVQIFKKTPAYDREAVATLLRADWDSVVQLWPRDVKGTLGRNPKLMLPDAQAEVYQSRGSWSEMFDREGLANRFPIFFWVLAVILFGVVGWPYLFVVAAPLPDRGYALSRPIGLLLVGWAIWWLASLKWVTFSVGGLMLVTLLWLVGGMAILWVKRDEFIPWVRHSQRLLLVEEAVFWALFGMVLFIRWANPDLWHPGLGGEKPMDFAYLNAVIKSTYFPPYDPWFAGGYINYYYFGFVLVAALTKITGVAPYIAYNLILPTLFAGLGLGAFGATLALTHRLTPTAGINFPPLPGRNTLVFATLGALFVAVIGNLGEVTLLFQGFRDLSTTTFESSLPGVQSLVKVLDGLFNGFLLEGKSLPFRQEWWYWNATRVISHPPTEAGPINEMPWFTFLYADLHAHMMALPYTVAALGIALAFLRDRARQITLGEVGRLGLLGLLVGSLWPINTWDFPTYALAALAAFMLQAWYRHGSNWSALIWAIVWRWGAMMLLGYVLMYPFHYSYGSAVSGIELWKGSRTNMADYLTIHGFFLFCITAALLADWALSRDLNGTARIFRIMGRRWYRLGRLSRLHGLLVKPSPLYIVGLYLAVLSWVFALLLVLMFGMTVPALIVALATLTVLLFFRRGGWGDRALWQMALILIFAGLGLTLSVEFVVLKNIDIGRMNTVFKFYMQVWVLWGIAAAVSAAFVFPRLRQVRAEFGSVYRTGFALLLFACFLYPIFSTYGKVNDRFDRSVGPTLNGMAFMEKAVHYDRGQPVTLAHEQDAMQWMMDHLPGSPVIAEINTSPVLYGWGNRYAMFTGNPSVIGWDWHQRQQRGAARSDENISRRIQDVQRAYSTTDINDAYSVFQQYGVQYFVVGPLERAYYPDGQNKWDAGIGLMWDMVYQNPEVKIYRIKSRSTAQR